VRREDAPGVEATFGGPDELLSLKRAAGRPEDLEDSRELGCRQARRHGGAVSAVTAVAAQPERVALPDRVGGEQEHTRQGESASTSTQVEPLFLGASQRLSRLALTGWGRPAPAG
jgi:hypothetical protein